MSGCRLLEGQLCNIMMVVSYWRDSYRWYLLLQDLLRVMVSCLRVSYGWWSPTRGTAMGDGLLLEG